MKKRTAIFLAYWFFAAMLVPSQVAWAYIDPATTTYIIQIAAAIVITLGVSLGVVLYKFQMIMTNLSVSAHALFKRMGTKRGASGAEGGESAGGGTGTMGEKEALESGIIDYAIPVRSTYPALAKDPPMKPQAKGEEAAPAPPAPGRLRAFGHWLWDDDRGFRRRLLIAALVAAAVAFTFVVFSMLDSAIQNETALIFGFDDVVVPVLILALAVFAVVLGVLLVLRGRAFDFVVCLVLSLLICGYLQSTFFNASFGKLIGISLKWQDLGVGAVLTNLAIWVAVFALVFYLGFSRRGGTRRFYGKLSLFAPSLLIAVQLVALLAIIPSTSSKVYADTQMPSANPVPSAAQTPSNSPAPDATQTQGSSPAPGAAQMPGVGASPEQSPGYQPRQTLTTEHMYDVASGKNVIVFIVDMLDEQFVDNIVADDPGFFNNLDGFTRFTNNITNYNETFPSVVNLLTGVPYDPAVPSGQYTDEAFAQGSFVDDIRAQGYSSDLYMDKWYTYTDNTPLANIADNLDTNEYTVNEPAALGQLGQLVLLKSAPLALKDTFSISPESYGLGSSAIQVKGMKPYAADDFKFFSGLKGKRLSEAAGKNHFAFYHLNGSHYAWHMDENTQYSKEETTGEAQTKGCFRILQEYFNQMKALGIYKDATIIITGDHPTHTSWMVPDRPMLTGLFVKPSGAEGSPLQLNNAPVTIDNMRATCVEAAGGDKRPWGRTYFEVPENEPAVRDYYNRYEDNEAKVYNIAHFRIVGDGRDWSNWQLVEQIPYDPKKRNL